jgi:hypothetical protein
MQNKDNKNEKRYIVAARVDSDYADCIVAEEDALIVATHRKVFGPASKQGCEQWKSRNCK